VAAGVRVAVSDVSGRDVRTAVIDGATADIDVHGLGAGVYLATSGPRS